MVKWLDEPEAHDFDAAADFLSSGRRSERRRQDGCGVAACQAGVPQGQRHSAGSRPGAAADDEPAREGGSGQDRCAASGSRPSCWSVAMRSVVRGCRSPTATTGCARATSPTKTPTSLAVWCPGRHDRLRLPHAGAAGRDRAGWTALAALPGVRIPVIIGELLVGVVVGKTGFGIVDHTDPTFTLLANVGFALVMFVVGTHVPVRDSSLAFVHPEGIGPRRPRWRRCSRPRCGARRDLRNRSRGALRGAHGLIVSRAGITGDGLARPRRPAGAGGDRPDRDCRRGLNRSAAVGDRPIPRGARGARRTGYRGVRSGSVPGAEDRGPPRLAQTAASLFGEAQGSRSSCGSAC